MRGKPRCFAHRPFPSIITAIWVGMFPFAFKCCWNLESSPRACFTPRALTLHQSLVFGENSANVIQGNGFQEELQTKRRIGEHAKWSGFSGFAFAHSEAAREARGLTIGRKISTLEQQNVGVLYGRRTAQTGFSFFPPCGNQAPRAFFYTIDRPQKIGEQYSLLGAIFFHCCRSFRERTKPLISE